MDTDLEGIERKELTPILLEYTNEKLRKLQTEESDISFSVVGNWSQTNFQTNFKRKERGEEISSKVSFVTTEKWCVVHDQ